MYYPEPRRGYDWSRGIIKEKVGKDRQKYQTRTKKINLFWKVGQLTNIRNGRVEREVDRTVWKHLIADWNQRREQRGMREHCQKLEKSAEKV